MDEILDLIVRVTLLVVLWIDLRRQIRSLPINEEDTKKLDLVLKSVEALRKR